MQGPGNEASHVPTVSTIAKMMNPQFVFPKIVHLSLYCLMFTCMGDDLNLKQKKGRMSLLLCQKWDGLINFWRLQLYQKSQERRIEIMFSVRCRFGLVCTIL